ncbi:MAG: hypothetical protein ACTSV2_06460 [Candidatus Thorarchaeota archaeon]
MQSSDCKILEENAEEMAKEGHNDQAVELFLRSANCWKRWESFGKAALTFERAYEHAMLAHKFTLAAETMQKAAQAWVRQGEHEKFEIDFQIAAEAFVFAAEEEKDPLRFVDGAFCAILGGELDLARQLIHAAAETTKGKVKEQINLALMLSEYHYGDADMYIESAIVRTLDRKGVKRIKEIFELAFDGFVRALLESEAAVTIRSIADGTGMAPERVEKLIEKGIENGQIPAYLDRETFELIVDSDRFDVDDLARRKGPIMSRELKDPGAWDLDLEE